MYFGIVKYSFNSYKYVLGPFETEEEAWENIEESADKEYAYSTEANEWESEINKDRDSGEITIIDYVRPQPGVTEFFIIEIDNTRLM